MLASYVHPGTYAADMWIVAFVALFPDLTAVDCARDRANRNCSGGGVVRESFACEKKSFVSA